MKNALKINDALAAYADVKRREDLLWLRVVRGSGPIPAVEWRTLNQARAEIVDQLGEALQLAASTIDPDNLADALAALDRHPDRYRLSFQEQARYLLNPRH